MIKGISLYTGLKDYKNSDIIDFLRKHKNKKIDFIFTSLHISEAINPDLNIILNEIKDTNIKLVVDFSKKTYDLFNFNNSIIPRLDYGFSIDNIIEMLNKHDLIELNASIINVELLTELKMRNVDFKKLRVSFNFYPKPLTGMGYDEVISRCKLFHEYNLKVIIYMPCSSKRPPLYKGLPTIEEQRYQTLMDNLNELNYLDIDGVCIGDAIISDEELDLLLNFEKQEINELNLKINLLPNLTKEELAIINLKHIIRIDSSPFLIRSSASRSKQTIIPNITPPYFKKGDVVIDNNKLLRYMGELSIIKQDTKNDGSMNKVGTILFKPELIKKGITIKFYQ